MVPSKGSSSEKDSTLSIPSWRNATELNEKYKVMKLTSFIIPAHNCATTIENTVKSIVAIQIDSEIIIVENGSTDNTANVIKSMADTYSNIKLFTSDKGVSKARNKGMDVATGDWIIFVDADDKSLPGVVEMREQLSTQDLDLIVGSYKKDDDIICHNYNSLNTTTGVTDEIKSWLISKPTLRMQAWAKIYRASFLKQYNLRFDESLSYSEDSEFVIRVLMKARKVLITDNMFYQYNSGTVSAMRGFVDGRIEKYIMALEKAQNDIKGESSKVQQAFIDYVIAHINIMGVHDVFEVEIKESWKTRCMKMKKLMAESVIRESIESKSVSMSINMLPILLCKNHLIALGGIVYYVRSFQNRMRYKKARKYNQ